MPRREAPEEEAKDNSLTAIAVCRRTHAPTMLGRSSDAVRLLHASSESLQGATRQAIQASLCLRLLHAGRSALGRRAKGRKVFVK